MDVEGILKRNLAEVEARIAEACRRSGRAREEVTLVAVTKYVNAETARKLVELGVANLGESRPQELWRKAAAVPEARWHLVGHLQRNKIERTLPIARLIHSVDSFRLLEALEAEADKRGRKVDVLLEFSLSGEVSKHGFAVKDLPLVITELEQLRVVRVVGLMTMAALDTPDQSRQTFAALRELRDRLTPPTPKEPVRHTLSHLSMGMTGDFEVAIEEGATLVRIGSALFRGLEAAS